MAWSRMTLSGQGFIKSVAAKPSVHNAANPSRHFTWLRWVKSIRRSLFSFLGPFIASDTSCESHFALRTSRRLQRRPRAFGELRNQPRPLHRLATANRVALADESEAPIKPDVARGDLRHRLQIGLSKSRVAFLKMTSHGGIHQAPPFQLCQKMAGIIRRVGVTKHVQIEQPQPIARPQKLSAGHIAVHRRRRGWLQARPGLLHHLYHRLDNTGGARPAPPG